ncbi:MAG: ABC transporter ATP-binding protein [bacterium]|nr:ABC transporter ATP-binding protein [bacterium]
MINIINLSKQYHNVTAVNDLNLNVKKGEIFGFIGPNGAGKTTTIKMIAGLLKPTTGNITIDNIDISLNPIEAKKITGLIPDEPFLYEKLTGWEFLYFFGQLYNIDKDIIESKASKLLDLFNLSYESNDLIEGYSHGMKQKLIMISALLHEPKVLIVDEPMVGLDPRSSKIVKNIFIELAKKGVTIFMSTHTLSLAQEICDRIGIIYRGKLIAVGTLDELQSKAESNENLEEVFLKLTEK